MNKNIPESQRAAELVAARLHECWVNAADLMTMPEFAGAAYVEGAVGLGNGLAQQHAWIVCQGEIIDPTLPDQGLRYVSAHQWEFWDFMRLRGEEGGMPFFRREVHHVEMDKAMEQARESIDPFRLA